MQICGTMYALGSDGVGNVNDDEQYIAGLIASKSFPERVPTIVDTLKEDSPASEKQKSDSLFQEDWLKSSKKKKEKAEKSKAEGARKRHDPPHDPLDGLVNDNKETPAKRVRLTQQKKEAEGGTEA